MRKTIILALLVVGCSEKGSAVVDLGKGRYIVTNSSALGIAGAHELAVQSANAYCFDFHKKAVVEGFEDAYSIRGVDSSVTFRCE